MFYNFSPTLRLGCPAYFCFKKIFRYKPEVPDPFVSLIGRTIHRVGESLFGEGETTEKNILALPALKRVLSQVIEEAVTKGSTIENVSTARKTKELNYLVRMSRVMLEAREAILKEFEVLAVEQRYEIKILPHVSMNGVVDLELKNKKEGTYWAWDWKSNRKIPNRLDARMRSQVAYYTFFLSKNYKVDLEQTGMSFCFLGGAKPRILSIKGSRDLLRNEMFKVKSFILGTSSGGVFARIPSKENCRWCEYKNSCSLIERNRIVVENWEKMKK